MYIVDKRHQVRPSQIQKVALDCSFIPDASSLSTHDGLDQVRLEPTHPKHAHATHVGLLSMQRLSLQVAIVKVRFVNQGPTV
jgi:hypothetical protein